MDIPEEIREEEAMIGKLETTEKKNGVIQQLQKNQRNLKVKNDLNHRWINLTQKIQK